MPQIIVQEIPDCDISFVHLRIALTVVCPSVCPSVCHSLELCERDRLNQILTPVT